MKISHGLHSLGKLQYLNGQYAFATETFQLAIQAYRDKSNSLLNSVELAWMLFHLAQSYQSAEPKKKNMAYTEALAILVEAGATLEIKEMCSKLSWLLLLELESLDTRLQLPLVINNILDTFRRDGNMALGVNIEQRMILTAVRYLRNLGQRCRLIANYVVACELQIAASEVNNLLQAEHTAEQEALVYFELGLNLRSLKIVAEFKRCVKFSVMKMRQACSKYMYIGLSEGCILLLLYSRIAYFSERLACSELHIQRSNVQCCDLLRKTRPT